MPEPWRRVRVSRPDPCTRPAHGAGAGRPVPAPGQGK